MRDDEKKTLYKYIRFAAAIVLVLVASSVLMYNYKLNKYENSYEAMSEEENDAMEETVFIVNSEGNTVFGTNALLNASTGSVLAEVPTNIYNTSGLASVPSLQGNAASSGAQVTVLPAVPVTQEYAMAVWQSYLTAPWKNPNFIALQTANPDIYSWISVKDTKINYPILQSLIDDEYYLNHNLDGTKGYPGCLYTQRVNTRTFQDVLTVVYGHNMKNGTMFGGLKNYATKKYFDSHSEILVETPTEKIIYDVICAARTDDTNLFVKFRMTEAVGVKKLILSLCNQKDTIYKPQMIDGITETDKFIALSTCRSIDKSGRYVVIAKRRAIPPLQLDATPAAQ